MSCRVLGRQVEQATLNVLAAEARRRGYKSPDRRIPLNPKNALVRDHYASAGISGRGPMTKGEAILAFIFGRIRSVQHIYRSRGDAGVTDL